MSELTIRMEETPNPNARRYVLNRPVQDEPKGRFFTDPQSSDEPLVGALFALEGISSVMLLPNSITINKEADRDWAVLDAASRAALESYFSA